MFDDFDEFVEYHQISYEELGPAFAVWLDGSGWDGDYQKVGE